MRDGIFEEVMKERRAKIQNLTRQLERIPYEIKKEDVGRSFGVFTGFGRVQEVDVGKLVFIKDNTVLMENEEQMKKRQERYKTYIDPLQGR